ncbi:hypothetical protein GGR56DRAFT_98695 [Xylariaceae sp. FL0804]|nr:hypothetical protein GGR56DRAFT_98695 [Xylariaceae sp. FL0804]
MRSIRANAGWRVSDVTDFSSRCCCPELLGSRYLSHVQRLLLMRWSSWQAPSESHPPPSVDLFRLLRRCCDVHRRANVNTSTKCPGHFVDRGRNVARRDDLAGCTMSASSRSSMAVVQVVCGSSTPRPRLPRDISGAAAGLNRKTLVVSNIERLLLHKPSNARRPYFRAACSAQVSTLLRTRLWTRQITHLASFIAGPSVWVSMIQ